MSEHTAENDAPKVITEYALLRNGVVVSGPQEHPRWNETITLAEAAERWYPDAEVVARTRTVYPDRVTDWTPVIPPGSTGRP
jgi:hypothetical protein